MNPTELRQVYSILVRNSVTDGWWVLQLGMMSLLVLAVRLDDLTCQFAQVAPATNCDKLLQNRWTFDCWGDRTVPCCIQFNKTALICYEFSSIPSQVIFWFIWQVFIKAAWANDKRDWKEIKEVKRCCKREMQLKVQAAFRFMTSTSWNIIQCSAASLRRSAAEPSNNWSSSVIGCALCSSTKYTTGRQPQFVYAVFSANDSQNIVKEYELLII